MSQWKQLTGAATAMTWRDLLAVVLCACVLAAVGLRVFNVGEAKRIWMCKQRLGGLGSAFAEYAADHDNALPPAVVDTGEKAATWDLAVARYLAGTMRGTNLWQNEQGRRRLSWRFHCPSDTEPRGGQKPRSYSMPMYDVRRHGWPPTADSEGGLGLYLDEERLKRARAGEATLPAGSLPTLRLSLVADPGWTALLVEQVTIRNILGSTGFAVTAGPRQQWNAKSITLKSFHRSRLNYLMLDGHVERLTIRESGGHTGHGGVWTIRSWD